MSKINPDEGQCVQTYSNPSSPPVMSYWKPGTEKPTNTLNSKRNDNTSVCSDSNTVTDKKKSNNATSKSELHSKLSKSVLGMKFMKTKVEILNNQDLNAIKASLDWKKDGTIDHFVTNNNQNNDKLVCKTDNFNFNAVLPGRRSFNGCNKAMERHYQMQLDHLKFQTKMDSNIEANIATTRDTMDEEMIKKYEQLVGLPRGPSGGMMTNNDSKKRKLNNKADHSRKTDKN